ELRLLADIYQRRGQSELEGATLQRIGNIYAEMGEPEEALDNLRRAVELIPDSLELLREIVGYCIQQGLSEEAVQYQIVIARHYFDTKQVKEAVAALQQLITIDRNNYEAYDLLGRTNNPWAKKNKPGRSSATWPESNPQNPHAEQRLKPYKKCEQETR